MSVVKEKVQEMISAPSCCAELKEVGQAWLDAVETDKESAVTQKLLAEIEEDLMPIDGMISFAESERCVQMFGEKGAADEYTIATMNRGKASECVGCGQCERACPQQLKIIQLLKDCAGALE